MNNKIVRLLSFFLAVVFIAVMPIACTNKNSTMKEETGKQETSKLETTNQDTASSNGTNQEIYPLKTDVKLKYWVPGQPLKTYTNFAETPLAKELEKRTGVKVEYIHPPLMQELDSLNILIASNDLPDIIEYNWNQFPRGAEKLMSDGVAIELNDVINKYAPNLKKLLESNPSYNKAVKTDTGKYWAFPFIRGDSTLMVYQGPIIRKDWLDELGLKVPETMDEWHTVLTAFKDKKNATAPFSYSPGSLNKFGGVNNGAFVGAYGIARYFYVEDSKVKFGAMEPGYKEFLAEFRKWYAEGILDKNFATLDGKIWDANMLGGRTGATVANNGGGLGRWMSTAADKDPKFNLVGAPYPTLKKGEKAKFGQRDAAFSGLTTCVITSKSKNVEAAVRFLDYGYGDEGHMLYNFGIEGDSYKMVNDYPTYSDVIMKNPNKLSIAEAMSFYIRGSGGGPFVQDKRYIEQYLQLPQQKEALKLWSNTDAEEHMMPFVTLTSEEATQVTKIMNDVDTYEGEMHLKFIMGVEPMENFDKYVEQIKKLGIEKAISLYQAAVDRYNKR